MDKDMVEKTAFLQNENCVSVGPKKRSGIPLPIWKGSQKGRQALAAVSEFQQNIVQGSAGHRPVQGQPTQATARPGQQLEQAGWIRVQPTQAMQPTQAIARPEQHAVVGIRTQPTQAIARSKQHAVGVRTQHTPAVARPEQHAVDIKTQPIPATARLEQHAVEIRTQPTQDIAKPEQQSVGIRTQPTQDISKPEQLSVGIRAQPTLDIVKSEQHTLGIRAQPTSTPGRSEQHVVGIRIQPTPLEQQAVVIRTQSSKSLHPAVASDAHSVTMPKIPKPPAVEIMRPEAESGSKSKQPGVSSARLESMVEEQQQSEFQQDMSALTNKGITVSAQGTVDDMFRPQRITEGQGRPVYIPAKQSKQYMGLMAGTPGTPRRVAITPQSKQYVGLMADTPGTPSAAFRQVAITPVMLGSESHKKRLRWADILSSSSPDVRSTEQTTEPTPCLGNIGSTLHSALKQDTGQQEPLLHSLPPQPTTSTSFDPCSMTRASVFTSCHGEQSHGYRPWLSAQLHTVSDGTEGDGLHEELKERCGRKATADSNCVTSVDDVDGEHTSLVDRQAAAVTCDNSAGATTSSQTDILKHLQVLEDREQSIQNEIQQLRMTMQKGKEADSNGSHVSHTTQISQSAVNHCSLSNFCQSHLPDDGDDDGMSLLQGVLQGPCFSLPQTSFDHDKVSAPSLELMTAAIHIPNSSTVSNHESCRTSSTVINCESSCSIDSQAGTYFSNTGQSKYVSGNRSCVEHLVSALTQVTEVLPDIWPTKNAKPWSPASMLSFACQGRMSGNGEKNNSLCVTLAGNKAKTQQYDCDTEYSRCGFSSKSEHGMECNEPLSEKMIEKSSHWCTHGAQSETEQHEHDSERDFFETARALTQVSSEPFCHHGPRKTEASNELQRQNVNPDAERKENKAAPKNEVGRLNADGYPIKRPVSTRPSIVHKLHFTSQSPVSVIVQPTAVSQPLHTNRSQMTAIMNFSPPVWTRLALQCAAANRTQKSLNVINLYHAQDNSTSLPNSREAVAEERNLSNEHTSHESVQQDSMKNSSNGNCSTLWSACRADTSSSERFSHHNRQDQRQRRLKSTSTVNIENSDIFMEALLDDECALYAGRLQSYFRNLTTVCDRQEIPDPVARTLNEGDDMHFIPICEDNFAFSNRPVAIENSAFVSYLAV